MKKIFMFLYILLAFFLFIACKVDIGDMSSSWASANSGIKDYSGTVEHYADEKGIHIRIPLNEKIKINNIILYEVSGRKEIPMASVKLISDKYYYALDGSPCGEEMTEVRDGQSYTVSATYHTNYFNETIKIDLPFVEPGKNYDFLLCLDEPVYYEDTGTKTYSNSNNPPRHFFIFSQSAASETALSEIIEASYNSETDKYTAKALDIKKIGLPFDVVDDNDFLFSISANYLDSLDSKRSPLVVPLSLKTTEETEVSLSLLAELIPDADYGADYILKSVSGSFSFTEHTPDSFDEAATADEKRSYYEKLYRQKSYTFNCPSISDSKLPQKVNFADKRMAITVTPQADSNLVAFTLLTDSNVINIYRKSPDEKDAFLAGTMTGTFVCGEKYSFPDYYSESGKNYSYHVTWNDDKTQRKSRDVSVTTTSSMKYKPNAPVITYEYDSEMERGIFTVVKNPLTDKLPVGYKGQIDFEYNYYLKFTLYDTDTSVIIPKSTLTKLTDDYNSVKTPYKITVTGEIDSITYTHYALLTEQGSMPKVPRIKSQWELEQEEIEKEKNKKITKDDILLEPGQEFYDFKPEVEGDYAELRSVTQKNDGTVEIKIYLPNWTNYAYIERNYSVKVTKEMFYSGFDKYGYDNASWDGGNEYYFIQKSIFYIDVDKHVGEITIIDFDITPGKEYQYLLRTDSVSKIVIDGERIDNYTHCWCNKTFDKSSDYYLLTVPVVNELLEIEGNLVLSKLPAGYSMLDGKEITQQDVTNLSNLLNVYDKNGNYISYEKLENLHLYIKSLVTTARKENINPYIFYTCTEVTGSDKYYIDEYGNKTEKIYDENSSELKYEIQKELKAHLYEQPNNPYLKLDDNWKKLSYHDLLSGNYSVTKVSMPFICEYGIWYYKEINLDRVTNKTFTVEK